MWERRNDSDSKIMKKREGAVHEKRWGGCKEGTKTRIPEK